MTAEVLCHKLHEFINPAYPEIEIRVEDKDAQRHIYFTDKKFAHLYPRQRYHYLVHSIPAEFFKAKLEDTVWYELAPGEAPADLDYHNEEGLAIIKDTILEILCGRTDFIKTLDNLFLNEKAVCHGDYRHSKQILTDLKFNEEEQFDIFHVLMDEGRYCDCEILYNTFTESGYAKKYWMERGE